MNKEKKWQRKKVERNRDREMEKWTEIGMDRDGDRNWLIDRNQERKRGMEVDSDREKERESTWAKQEIERRRGIEKEWEKKKRLEQVGKWARERDGGWVGEREIRRETKTHKEREKNGKEFCVDFEVTLWMKMNIFHDRWFVNDLKEETGNLFSQSILTRLLCIVLLWVNIRNVLIFWFKMEPMWIWKMWGFLFCFWFRQTHTKVEERRVIVWRKREIEKKMWEKKRVEEEIFECVCFFLFFIFLSCRWRVKEEWLFEGKERKRRRCERRRELKKKYLSVLVFLFFIFLS